MWCIVSKAHNAEEGQMKQVSNNTSVVLYPRRTQMNQKNMACRHGMMVYA